jgi:hypothetical protein
MQRRLSVLITLWLARDLMAFSPARQLPSRQSISLLCSSKSDPLAQDALEKTASYLEKLKEQRQAPKIDENGPYDPLSVEREKLYRQYLLQAANSLKVELKTRKLPRNGRKPDLAMRLAADDLRKIYGESIKGEEDEDVPFKQLIADDDKFNDMQETKIVVERLIDFAGLKLSPVAGDALSWAKFFKPSPIQTAAIPRLVRGASCILHAETGSGKTLAFLLPLTEYLWTQEQDRDSFAVVMAPTRELASQIAGIAAVLAPPGTVRFISRPTDLMADGAKERGVPINVDELGTKPRLFIGSAKTIMHSLYGDGKMPAPPTRKPEAMEFLKNVRCIVMDEVDRMLAVQKSRAEKQYKKIHEKPAAVVCAAVTRLTLGRVQIVAASATVGRPLRRELARVLGLPPQECPPVVCASDATGGTGKDLAITRAVTIPDSVTNYVVPTSGSSPGQLLTAAYQVIQSLTVVKSNARILLVLSKGFGMNTQNSIGALKHFGCKPEPQNLLDTLEADGTEHMIELYREVSGVDGVGQSRRQGDKAASSGYVLVTGEDTVRGLHLDGLDYVLVLGRPNGPDEYTHIAGRTGRAGTPGKVFSILSESDSASLVSWSRMLGVEFHTISNAQIKSIEP